MKQWGVYILRCGDGTLYTGATDDLDRRLAAHRAGKGAKYTRSRGPLEPVYWEPCADLSAAYRREYAIKQLSRRQKLALIAAPPVIVLDKARPVCYTEKEKSVISDTEVCNMYDVIALGELLIDFTTQATDPDGYPTMAAHPGGAPANFLAAIAKYGGRAGMLGKVGTDTFGRLLTNTLRQAGIETRGLTASDDFFTTLAFVTLDAHGDREFAFARKPGADTQLTFDELDLSLIDAARVLHFGTLSLTDEPVRTTTRRAVEYAKQRGKLISFDPNLRKPLWRDLEDAKEQMRWGLAHADVVKISDEEVEFLFGLDAAAGAAYILEHFPARLVFVTCGPDGCYFKNKGASGHVDSLKGIRVVDTTGAGDIFGGSALWGVLQSGVQPEALDEAALRGIVRYACTAAGLSTTKHGGISSVPDRAQVLAALADE